jgi:hypothetical protein
MTPAEELARLNRLLRQYETVYRTTKNPQQHERVARQIKELRTEREKLLAVHALDPDLTTVEESGEDEAEDEESFPILERLREYNATARPQDAVAPFNPKREPPTPSQEDMYNLALYMRRFESEFLPFLTAQQLKLDFKFSLDRDSFYSPYQALQRSLQDYREECQRIAEAPAAKDRDRDIRQRAANLSRQIAVEGARFFRALQRFAAELALDAATNGTKCLNGNSRIAFDVVEGKRALQGRLVREGLEELERLSAEAVAYLNVPEIEISEGERADRR